MYKITPYDFILNKNEKKNQKNCIQNVNIQKKHNSFKCYIKTPQRNRMHVYLKDKSIVPSKEQIQKTDKLLKQLQQRTFYKKKLHWQQIFQENCKLYKQLQKQTSSYFFIRKKSYAHFLSSCKSTAQIARTTPNPSQMKKTRATNNLSVTKNKNQFSQRYSQSSCHRNSKCFRNIYQSQGNFSNLSHDSKKLSVQSLKKASNEKLKQRKSDQNEQNPLSEIKIELNRKLSRSYFKTKKPKTLKNKLKNRLSTHQQRKLMNQFPKNVGQTVENIFF